jgi:anti-sigma factor RsiW
MEIKRNTILDLLPLYLSGEASAETKALVERYLASDPELAEIAQRLNGLVKVKPEDIPRPVQKDDHMEAYKQAQRMIQRRTVMWGVVIAVVALAIFGLAFLVYFMMVPVN